MKTKLTQDGSAVVGTILVLNECYEKEVTVRRAAINSDSVRIVGFSNTSIVTRTAITESLDFRGLALSAKYRLFLAHTAKGTQMSFSRM